MRYKVKTPAKINIGLKVLGKRKDDYHNIETIFYPVNIFDTITLKINKTDGKTNKFSFKSEIKKLNNDKNLCIVAAKNFLEAKPQKDNYLIEIEADKNIPIGAGLGGGSSDAAAVLQILSRHFKIKKNKVIKDIAANIGSDVNFFLQKVPCYATSRGEELKPLKKFKINYKIFIVYPDLNIPTARAYKSLKIKKSKKPVMDGIKQFNIKQAELLQNDFERVVFRDKPLLMEIKNRMYFNGALFSSMSGSGSSIYGFFNKKTDLKSLKSEFEKAGYQTFIS